MDNRKVSICIPTFNRYEMTIESFAQVLSDPRVDEVVIVDDCSTDGSFERLIAYFSIEPKVRIAINECNQDCYWNKKIAIDYAHNEWCILLDSDNIIGTDYLDRIFDKPFWFLDTIMQPIFAKPHFDFRKFSGKFIDRLTVKKYLHDELFTTALNAANFFVNRNTYLKAFDPDTDPVTSDSIYMAYRLLEQGNKYYFVPGLEYEHRVGHPSHYTANVHRTPSGFHQSLLDKLATL